MLTQFQQEVARLLPHLPEAEGFALAGGAALIVRDMVDRETRDLDFFGPEAAAVNRLAPAFEHAARQAGMAVARTFDAPGFVRSEVTRGHDRCEVDVGYDARLWPLQQTSLGPTIGDNEMVANKTLALFGRAAARDFLDVQALARRYGEQRLVELAVAKDLGFPALTSPRPSPRSTVSTDASETTFARRVVSPPKPSPWYSKSNRSSVNAKEGAMCERTFP